MGRRRQSKLTASEAGYLINPAQEAEELIVMLVEENARLRSLVLFLTRETALLTATAAASDLTFPPRYRPN
ncbi:hypothetical protein [Bradyrhizobium guangzhouense]|uniref:hypothetical protein n=1 Tax=Bradyrhizobium guangzhouense TaxID=1325095 RepID=UPI001009AFAF|nr:hypothetical protein [Bradyrhizobium guangzhouense]RXH10131.1 hypothetical protein EAS54_32295 [Bradyrhizobium guangzhouense]